MRLSFFFLLFLSVSSTFAQDEAPGQRSFGVQSSFAVSFSGYSVSLVAVYKVAYNEFYLGPVLSISNSYLPGSGPWGFNTGWRYNYANHKKVGAFAMIDYRNAFYRAFDPANLRSPKWNSIHEVNVALGFKWQFAPLWVFNAALGTGVYMERNHDISGDQLINHSGYSNLLKATFLRQLSK
jgi:hypothetical protein